MSKLIENMVWKLTLFVIVRDCALEDTGVGTYQKSGRIFFVKRLD